MKKYALAGASVRGMGMYAMPLFNDYADVAKIVGIFDINYKRSDNIRKNTDPDIPTFTDFDQMIRETKPDVVIVTTVDQFHDEFIIRSLEYGCDVITEKPMTVNETKCNAILEAEARTGKTVTVTFNYRFTPFVTRIKELMREGAVGKVLSVDFEYLLDTSHGADYFRRWHSKMENSGGLLVHKSTHHFDLINWWIDAVPDQVYAHANLRYYGPTRENRGPRCRICNYKDECEYVCKLYGNPTAEAMYFQCEDVDGYYRDRCLFSEDIDIYDNMSVLVKYADQTLLTYSLIAFSPYEGWKVAITGTDGRLEAAEYHSGHRAAEPSYYVDIFNRRGEKITYDVPKASGGHGGGDVRLRDMLFHGKKEDPLGHFAGSVDGARSIMIGVCANKSIKDGKSYRIGDLVPGIE